MPSNYDRKGIFKSALLASYSIMLLAPLSLTAAIDDKESINYQGLSAAIDSHPPTSASKPQTVTGGKLGPHVGALLSPDSLSSRSSGAITLIDTPFMRVKSGRLAQIYITLDVINEATLASLEAFGVEIELTNQQLNKVQGWASVSTIEALLKTKHVVRIETPKYAQPRIGSALTQGDAIIKSNLLRQLGFKGQGIKVGVVSDGSNNWTTARASGDLPNSITQYGSCSIRAENQTICRSARTCNEGTAMAEIIHDIAPEAKLAIASVNTSLEFIARINQLANSFGADVIVDDLGFFGEPYFADGDLAKAVQALPPHVLYVSSAGNAGHVHYQAPYTAGTSGFHNFTANPNQEPDYAMGFIISARRGAFALLQWDDPFNAAQSDFDLYVSDLSGPVVQSAYHDSTPFEAVCIYNGSYSDKVYFAEVDKFFGNDKQLKMYLLGAGAIEYPIRQGSIFGHAATSRAIAVGSVQASDPGHDTIAFYSSGGPSEIRLPSPQTRRKPDLVAIDGVSVSGAGGFPATFYGTSAAAPHVAGVAALLMSAHPKATSNAIRVALTRSAEDLGTRGFDFTYGYGLINASAANDRLPLVNLAPAIMLLLGDDPEP